MSENNNKEALFRSAPIPKAVLELAIPTVIGQIILVIYNMADAFFIGLTGSDSMITAVTVCMPAFTAISAVSNLFGVGGAAAMSRYRGSSDPESASGASVFAVYGCILTAAMYSLLTRIFMDPFIRLLGGGHPQVFGYVRQYLTRTLVLGGIPTALGTMLSHLIRSEGHSVHAAAGVALGGILNIALDPLFMFRILPKGMEVAGAATATAVSNCIAFLYFVTVILLSGKKTVIRFRPQRKALDRAIAKEILSSGLPACIMTLFENVSYAILDNLLSRYGIIIQAGIGVAKKVNMLAHCMVRGISQGVLPLIGYNYAAKNIKRMRAAFTFALALSAGLSTLWMLVSLIFPRPLISIFLGEGQSTEYGILFLRILCLGCPLSAVAYMIISFFQAVGSGRRSFLLAILRKGVLDIPLMFLLGALIPIYGVVMATPVTDGICCFAAIILVRRFLRHHHELDAAA